MPVPIMTVVVAMIAFVDLVPYALRDQANGRR
jgi:hypothetical protein